MNRSARLLAAAAAALLSSASLAADVVVTVDGARLTGTILSIDGGVITLDTAFGGEIEIAQEEVATFSMDSERNIRFESGATMAGTIGPDSTGNIVVTGPDGSLSAPAAGIAAAWGLDETDPEVLRNQRSWRYEAAFDLLGSTGNTEEFGVGAFGLAQLRGPDDTLRIFGEYEYRTQNDTKSADRARGGGRYTHYFTEHLGWYVRSEIEYNDIQFISFRSSSAAGLDYRWINQENWNLDTRAGLGYRFTSFSDGTPDESSGILDFGLSHRYQFNETFRMLNDVSYTPALDDFADYVILHESSIEMPVGTGDYWFLRLGIRNEYNSRPAGDAERLDTTYFARLLLSWE